MLVDKHFSCKIMQIIYYISGHQPSCNLFELKKVMKRQTSDMNNKKDHHLAAPDPQEFVAFSYIQYRALKSLLHSLNVVFGTITIAISDFKTRQEAFGSFS